MTDSPDTPTVPDDLVQAVHDATCTAYWHHTCRKPELRAVLGAVPPGWGTNDKGEWVRVDDLITEAREQALQDERDERDLMDP